MALPGGIKSVEQLGTEHSDEMTPDGFLSNNAGGILGGISTGQDIVVSIAIKPTSSIRLTRQTIDIEQIERMPITDECAVTLALRIREMRDHDNARRVLP